MIDGNRVIAVVIGRAGSRGLPNKNVLMFAGRPMVCHTLEDARASTLVDRIVLSTDGDDIADAARAIDVEVVMRPHELATDTATVDSAVRHAVTTLADDAPIVVILYANVPIRPASLIDRAVRMLAGTGAESVQSYCPVGKHHPYWMMRLDESGRVHPFVENTVYRRQDLPDLLIPDGGVVAVTRECLFTTHSTAPHAFLGKDRRAVLTEPGEVVDLDTAFDLRLAETILGTRLDAALAPTE